MPSIPQNSSQEVSTDVKDITEIELTSDQKEVVKNITKTLGDSGTQRYSGFFLEEPNAQWRDEQRVDMVEEMRRGDAAVKAVLNAIKTPMLATGWYIESQDEKMKEFVNDNIFNMKRVWKDFLREAFSYLDFGHYCFELIFEKSKDGSIRLTDLAPRIPRSILKWEIAGGKPGITQILRTNQAEVGVTAEIPLGKLLVLTNDKEGDDITGQSILRASYKHYKFKDVLYRIQGIAAERYGVGIPVVILPDDFGTADSAKGEEMARNMRSNEKGYIVLPSSKWDVKILTPQGNPQGSSIESAIQHHNIAILMSVLASFLGLGSNSTGGGSFALSKDQSGFFIKHVEDKCTYFAEQFTEQVIKRLVFLNFGRNAEVPRLRFEPLGDIDFNEMSTVLKNLVDAGFIASDDSNMKQFTRKIFKLPEMTDEEIQAEEDQKQEEELKKLEEDTAQDEFSFVDDEQGFNQEDDNQQQDEADAEDTTNIEGDNNSGEEEEQEPTGAK